MACLWNTSEAAFFNTINLYVKAVKGYQLIIDSKLAQDTPIVEEVPGALFVDDVEERAAHNEEDHHDVAVPGGVVGALLAVQRREDVELRA